MKLHFESDLDYQQQAIAAVADLFHGQEICRTEFTVTRANELALESPDAKGIGNRLTLLDEEVLSNLAEIQLRHGLRPSGALDSGDFTVEMETGTGKTYVYLRTVFELNRQYGFTKFVIVVPSVAIKEGVFKTLQITEEHFRGLYANTPFEFFLYDSSKLGQVRNFATSSTIQVMVVTVGAINKKDVNNLYKDSEKTGGDKPIDLIRATRPIVIVDEPQSVDGGLEGKGKEALDAMHPLCTLRYSATHADKHHMVYRLDAVDAYQRKLVKQIEVDDGSIESGFNKPYVKLIEAKNVRGTVAARIEVDVLRGKEVSREIVPVRQGDNLEIVTGRDLYADIQINNIGCKKGEEFIELSNREQPLRIGEAIGGIDDDTIKRQLISRTIQEHLDKELRLRSQGIKVLSLFFIDRVENYRIYGDDGTPRKGKYALMFEEEYRRLAGRPKYKTLYGDVDLNSSAEEVHNGYFSMDKKGAWTDTAENNQTNRDAAERAYNLIMKEKEKLLSLDTPLKFIFSHSALREGWDNPNVFQICTLREIGTERDRRQTIGRGLRLCVNQQGQRVRDEGVNVLTVVGTERFQEFADKLQKEIEEDTGIRFGVVEKHQFAGIAITNSATGRTEPLGLTSSTALWTHLQQAGHVNAAGKVQDQLRTALKSGTLTLPPEFQAQKGQIEDILRKLSGRLDIKNKADRRQVKTRQAVLHSPEFKALWDRIKQRTTYRVQFDNEALIAKATEAIKNAPPISKARLNWRKAGLAIGRAGIDATEKAGASTITLDEGDIVLPDILTDLQDKTQLTRKTLVRVLVESGRLDDFKRNPQQFIEFAAEAINRTKRLSLVDGIKYQRLGDEHYYAQELFEQEELTGYLKNMLNSEKSAYEQVIYDSDTEARFADELEKNIAVKVYAKLPGWFQVPTPLGSYNPDWAVLIEKDGTEKLYFVVETKSSLFTDDIRDRESGKIKCGEAHFDAIATDANPAVFKKATRLADIIS